MEWLSFRMKQKYRGPEARLQHPLNRGPESMEEHMYPVASREIAKKREQLAPETLAAWRAFSRQVFADGALPAKTKELIAVAVAHVTRCPYCIRHHTAGAQSRRASAQEIMEAIWVAAEMRAGAAVAHSALAIDAMHQEAQQAE